MPCIEKADCNAVMDRQTLAFASVFGLPHDTGLVGEQYSLLGSVVL